MGSKHLCLGLIECDGGGVSERGKIVFDTPGEHTWTVPEGISKIWVSAAAGGGGGSGAGRNHVGDANDFMRAGSGGGGGDSFLCKQFEVTSGNVLQISVGAGGEGGNPGSATTVAPMDAKNGGSTSIAGLFSLEGGKTPTRDSVSIHVTSPYIGGLPGGDGGENGQIGARTLKGVIGQLPEDVSSKGRGGNTLLGWGAMCTYYTWPSGKYGGGGGGGLLNNHTPVFYKGSRGGDGVVIIEW